MERKELVINVKKRIGKKNNMRNNYGKTRNTQAWGECD